MSQSRAEPASCAQVARVLARGNRSPYTRFMPDSGQKLSDREADMQARHVAIGAALSDDVCSAGFRVVSVAEQYRCSGATGERESDGRWVVGRARVRRMAAPCNGRRGSQPLDAAKPPRSSLRPALFVPDVGAASAFRTICRLCAAVNVRCWGRRILIAAQVADTDRRRSRGERQALVAQQRSLSCRPWALIAVVLRVPPDFARADAVSMCWRP